MSARWGSDDLQARALGAEQLRGSEHPAVDPSRVHCFGTQRNVSGDGRLGEGLVQGLLPVLGGDIPSVNQHGHDIVPLSETGDPPGYLGTRPSMSATALRVHVSASAIRLAAAAAVRAPTSRVRITLRSRSARSLPACWALCSSVDQYSRKACSRARTRRRI